jgi:hypothetical protein
MCGGVRERERERDSERTSMKIFKLLSIKTRMTKFHADLRLFNVAQG